MSRQRITYLQRVRYTDNPFHEGYCRNVARFLCYWGTVSWEAIYNKRVGGGAGGGRGGGGRRVTEVPVSAARRRDEEDDEDDEEEVIEMEQRTAEEEEEEEVDRRTGNVS